MDKTIEEMKKAVLAYCEEVCPKFQDSYEIEGIVTLYREHGGIRVYNFDTNTMIFTSGKSNREGSIRYHYRLLGLAERDAVSTYKSSLQSDLKSMTAIVSSVKKGEQPDYVHVSKLAELQARNTALVAALERIKKEYGLEHGVLRGERPVINSLGEFINEVLEANTEKGGVQG